MWKWALWWWITVAKSIVTLINIKELLLPPWKPFYLVASETYSLYFSFPLFLSWFPWQQSLWFLGVCLPLFSTLSSHPLFAEKMSDNEVRSKWLLEQMNSQKQRSPFHANFHSNLTWRKEARVQDSKRTGWYSRLFHGALTSLWACHPSKHLFSVSHIKANTFPFWRETQRNIKSSLSHRAWVYIHSTSPWGHF